MLNEAKIALLNTANLMHEGGLLSIKDLLSSLETNQEGQIVTLQMDEEEKEENIFDKTIEVNDQNLKDREIFLEEKTKQIVKTIKEKI